DLEGANTTNTLKVHVAAEILATGRSVVDGKVSGPLYRTADGDLTDLPDGAILSVPADFDGEFGGDPARLGGIVSAYEGITGYPAIVARETGLPMISNVLLANVAESDRVTLDAGRGIVYEGTVGDCLLRAFRQLSPIVSKPRPLHAAGTVSRVTVRIVRYRVSIDGRVESRNDVVITVAYNAARCSLPRTSVRSYGI